MADCEQLLEKAKSGTSLRYSELVKLAECNGWTFRRNGSGSHRIFKNPNAKHYHTLSFVDRRGDVAHYHISTLLAAIELLEQK